VSDRPPPPAPPINEAYLYLECVTFCCRLLFTFDQHIITVVFLPSTHQRTPHPRTPSLEGRLLALRLPHVFIAAVGSNGIKITNTSQDHTWQGKASRSLDGKTKDTKHGS
jgi:hypothetical protein